MVLLVLAVLWMLVLVPPVLRARVEARKRDHERGADLARRELSLVTSPPSEGSATSQDVEVATLVTAANPEEDPGDSSIDAVSRRAPSLGVQRRRQGLFANLALMAITFLAGLVKMASGNAGGWIWRLHLASHLLLAGYLLALVVVGSRRRRAAAVIEANVRYFPVTPRLGPDEIGGQPLRRSVSS